MVVIASTLKIFSNLSDFQVRREQISANRAATANRATAFTEVLSRCCSTALACTQVNKYNNNSLILLGATRAATTNQGF